MCVLKCVVARWLTATDARMAEAEQMEKGAVAVQRMRS